MGYSVGDGHSGHGGGDGKVVDSNFGCGIVVMLVRVKEMVIVSGTCDGGDG